MGEFPAPNDSLANARREFRAFYTTATEDDAELMDRLIHTGEVLPCDGALTLNSIVRIVILSCFAVSFVGTSLGTR